jgi:hypothetical protein
MILGRVRTADRCWTMHLTPQNWQGKGFLNVGCAGGRNSFSSMTYGADPLEAAYLGDRSSLSSLETGRMVHRGASAAEFAL